MLRRLSLFLFSMVFVSTQIQVVFAQTGGKAAIEIEDADLGIDMPKKGGDEDTETDNDPGLRVGKKKPAIPARPKISAIPTDKGIVDGKTCALTESRASGQVMGALNALITAMSAVDQCTNDPALKTSIATANEIKKHGEKVSEMYQNRDELIKNEKLATDYQASLQALLTGLDKISEGIGKNPLVSTACGKKMMSGKEIVLAISDLAVEIVPLVMLGTSIGAISKLAISKVALKYLGGAAFIGVAAKAFNVAVRSDSVNMKDFSQQDALKKNLCEYAKVVERVNFIQDALAQESNKIDTEKIDVLISKYENDKKVFLKSILTPEIAELNSLRISVRDDLATHLKLVRQNDKSISAIKEFGGTDVNKVCTQGKLLVKGLAQKDGLANSVVKNLKTVISKQEFKTEEQNILLQQEDLLRQELIAATNLDTNRCAEKTTSYISALIDINKEIKNRVTRLESKFETELSQNPDYKLYKAQLTSINNELKARKAIKSVLGTLGKREGDIELSQMLAKLRLVTQSFFIRGGYGESPVTSWLNEYKSEFELSLSAATDEIASLVKASKEVQDLFEKNPDGSYKVVNGRKVFATVDGKKLDVKKIQQLQVENKKMAKNLGELNLRRLPVGSAQHAEVCQRLNNAYLEWNSALTHLRARQLMCEFIRPFKSTAHFESEIISHCFGEIHPITGRVNRLSLIQADDSDLYGNCHANELEFLTDSRGIRLTQSGKEISFCPNSLLKDAWLVNLKRKELNCELNKVAPIDQKKPAAGDLIKRATYSRE